MKTRFLIIITVFLLMLPWAKGLDFSPNNEVMVDGITTSAIIVMAVTVFFSLISWFLFSWASKTMILAGALLSIIVGASLLMPFLQVLGPMAGIVVGVVAGFAAFMLYKKAENPAKNLHVVVSAITIASAYLVLILMVLASQTISVWDTGNGVGTWTGTAEGMEKTGFANVLGSHIGFIYFLVTIPSLIITGLIIQDKQTKIKLLIIIGVVLMVEGLFATFYSSIILFPPTEPPMMRPLEGIEHDLFIHRQAFLFSSVIGIFVTIVGLLLFWKEKTGKRDLREIK